MDPGGTEGLIMWSASRGKSSVPKALTLVVGSYTDRGGQGIYLCSVESGSGEIRLKSVTADVANPSFFAIPGRRFLYAVSETSSEDRTGGGYVCALRFDERVSKIDFLNKQSSEGGNPCHLTVDRGGKYVLVSNYSSGSLAVLPIQNDGSLGSPTQVVQHFGSGTDPIRQKLPHPHSVVFDERGSHAFVPDLGMDKIVLYEYDRLLGKLNAMASQSVGVAPGAGPRHMDFHPSGRSAYVVNELDSTVAAFRFDSRHGTLHPTKTISTLPPSYSEKNLCGDIHVHPSGKFLYCSNRGHDSIVVFEVDSSGETLTILQYQPAGGKTPRNFAIDPQGKLLVVANQDSGTLVSFSINKKTGELTPTGHVLEIPVPVCPQFLDFYN